MASVLVLPSVLVGPAAYTGLVEAFRARGLEAEVALAPSDVRRGVDVLAAFETDVLRLRPDLVVAHSNAGLVAPAAAHGTPVVLVDAALPPSHGRGAMAPAPMLDLLASLADSSGLLPPWTSWWDEADVAPLFPDDATRRRIEAAQPRLPLAYFRSEVPVPTGWEGGRLAYLAFGGTYAAELAHARGLGWPTQVLDGALHLHHLHDPATVVRSVLTLADQRSRARGDAGSPGPV